MGRIPSRQPRSVLLSGDSDSFPAGSAGSRTCTRLCHPVAAVPQPRTVLKPWLHLRLPCSHPLLSLSCWGPLLSAHPPRTSPQDSPHVPDHPEQPLLPLPWLCLLCPRVPNSHFWVLFMLTLCLLSGQLDPWFLPALLRKQIRGRPGALLPACGSTTQHSPQTQDSPGCLVICEWGPTSPSQQLLVGSESLGHCQVGILRVTSSPSSVPLHSCLCLERVLNSSQTFHPGHCLRQARRPVWTTTTAPRQATDPAPLPRISSVRPAKPVGPLGSLMS